MKNILVIGNMYQRLSAQCHLCDQLTQARSQFNITFLTDYKVNELEKYNYFGTGGFFKTNKGAFSNQLIHLIYRCIRRLGVSVTLYFEAIMKYKELKKAYYYLAPKVKEGDYSAIIVNGDRHGGVEQVIIKIANDLKIPTICPYMVYSDDISCISDSYLYQLKWYSPLLMRYLKHKHSDQILHYKGLQYFFYMPSDFLSLKWFGTLSSYPWYIGCGGLDIVCVDHQHTYDRYIKNNVPRHKLKIIGDIVFDQLFNSFQLQIEDSPSRKYSLSPDKKTIICSLPQLYEEGQLGIASHWKETEFLVKTLCDTENNVILSLHPKMDRDSYCYLEQKFDCFITDERLEVVLPMADVFIATYSSTIIWAVLCEVPSIVVNFYGYSNNIYEFLNTVTIVTDKTEFFDVVERKYKNKESFNSDWEKISRNKVFDGKTMERFSKVLLNCQHHY